MAHLILITIWRCRTTGIPIISQVKKLNFKEIKWLAQGHIQLISTKTGFKLQGFLLKSNPFRAKCNYNHKLF